MIHLESRAGDGDGHTDTVTVEIQTEVPEAEPTVEPTAKPTATPEPPGFEAVFANFFASQKPLLKMLRHCRSVSNRILSAEEEKGVRTIHTNSKNKTTKF